MSRLRPALLLPVLLLAACAVPPAPGPQRPTIAADRYEQARITAPAVIGLPFDDPELDAQVTRALLANRDLAAAHARLDAARAVAASGRAQRLPDVVVESGASPVTRADRQPGAASVPGTGYELGLAASWEIDLYGRLRQAAQAAGAEAEATAAVLDGTRLAVVSEVANARVELCGAEALAEVAGKLAALRGRQHRIQGRRVEIGDAAAPDREAAGRARAEAEAALPALTADANRARYRLALLEGLPPPAAADDDRAPACGRLPDTPAVPATDAAAALLARRPDLREAERRLAAALARHGAVLAERWPRVQLGFSGGLIAGGVDAFVTPLLTWAFVNPARIGARIDAARADADGAQAAFDGAWLGALREAETALSDLAAEQRRNAALREAEARAAAFAQRIGSQARIGEAAPLAALDAEALALDAARLRLESDRRVALAVVARYRAFGGDPAGGAALARR